ncbi:MAG TPA: hypothetical protein VIL33_02205, partial [Rhodothermia bacterium]
LSVDIEEYYRIDAANEYFHLHAPVPQSKLAGELQQFDFGILPFFEGHSGLREEKMRFSTTMKLFNYLEAGLPVIVSRDLEYQAWILNRGGVGLAISASDIADLRRLIEATDYAALLRDVAIYRERLSLRKNLPRLVDFYRSLAPSAGFSPKRSDGMNRAATRS